MKRHHFGSLHEAARWKVKCGPHFYGAWAVKTLIARNFLSILCPLMSRLILKPKPGFDGVKKTESKMLLPPNYHAPHLIDMDHASNEVLSCKKATSLFIEYTTKLVCVLCFLLNFKIVIAYSIIFRCCSSLWYGWPSNSIERLEPRWVTFVIIGQIYTIKFPIF